MLQRKTRSCSQPRADAQFLSATAGRNVTVSLLTWVSLQSQRAPRLTELNIVGITEPSNCRWARAKEQARTKQDKFPCHGLWKEQKLLVLEDKLGLNPARCRRACHANLALSIPAQHGQKLADRIAALETKRNILKPSLNRDSLEFNREIYKPPTLEQCLLDISLIRFSACQKPKLA